MFEHFWRRLEAYDEILPPSASGRAAEWLVNKRAPVLSQMGRVWSNTKMFYIFRSLWGEKWIIFETNVNIPSPSNYFVSTRSPYLSCWISLAQATRKSWLMGFQIKLVRIFVLHLLGIIMGVRPASLWTTRALLGGRFLPPPSPPPPPEIRTGDAHWQIY